MKNQKNKMNATNAKKNIYMINRHCMRCSQELSDEEFKIKLAKDDDPLFLFGRMFYTPSYINCTPCKRKIFNLDIIVSTLLVIWCLFFIFK
jgi:hypothetical protein